MYVISFTPFWLADTNFDISGSVEEVQESEFELNLATTHRKLNCSRNGREQEKESTELYNFIYAYSRHVYLKQFTEEE